MTTTGERRASATDAAILEIVRRRTETSRVEISRELGVTPATVTYAVKRLLAADLLVEHGHARSNGGKRASLLRLNDRARWAIGCTIDTDRLSMVGVDLTGALRSRIVLPLPAVGGSAATGVEATAAEATGAEAADPAAISTTFRTALGMIAPAQHPDATTGIGFAIPAAGPGRGEELLAEVTRDLEIPWVGAPAPTCAALGSFWSGEQPETGLCATVHLDTELGITLTWDGRSLAVPAGQAPTLEHVMVDPAGPPCSCGGNGCLHQYASARAVRRRASEGSGLAADLDPELTEVSITSDVVRIALAAARDEPRARTVIEDAVTATARAVWGIVSALGVGTVILTGPYVQAAPVLAGEAMSAVLSSRAGRIGSEVQVTVSQVQPHPGAVGAAVLALQSFLEPRAG